MRTHLLVGLAVAAIVGAGAGHYTYQLGYTDGAKATTDAIQVTCDAPNKATVLNGKPYVCLDGHTWNHLVMFLRAIGVSGMPGSDNTEPPVPANDGGIKS